MVVLTGTGPAFCAGADLGGDNAHEKYDGSSVDAANLAIRAITELDMPVVCGLNGIAAGRRDVARPGLRPAWWPPSRPG